MLTISRLTREYLFWPIESPDDLSAATAEVAFMDDPATFPADADWNDADIVVYGAGSAVRILVGPGHASATPLVGGTDYQAWVRITDEPERPVRKTNLVVVE